MIKNFRFAGVALLAVGLTFAASSCQKQDFIENQDENQVVTIDLDELTKAPVADVAEATANVDAALEDIFSSMAKVPTLEEGEVAELKRLRSKLLSAFEGEYLLNIDKEYFKSTFQILAKVENSKYYVNLTYGNGYFKIKTPAGYYLEIELPTAWVDFSNEGPKAAINGSVTFTVGKNSAKIAEIEFDIFSDSIVNSKIYDKQGNPVARTILTYNHKTYKATSFKFLYNNKASAGDINYTDFAITDISKVYNALKEMTTIGYPYTEKEAAKIADKFNTYFTNTDGDGVAMFKGKEFRAVADNYKTVSGDRVYRVDLKLGDATVTALDICEFLYKYFKNIIDEQPLNQSAK